MPVLAAGLLGGCVVNTLGGEESAKFIGNLFRNQPCGFLRISTPPDTNFESIRQQDTILGEVVSHGKGLVSKFFHGGGYLNPVVAVAMVPKSHAT